MNWILRNDEPRLFAIAFASTVLPVPGTSSMRRWPRQSSATRASWTSWCLPTITRSTLAITRSPDSWIFVIVLADSCRCASGGRGQSGDGTGPTSRGVGRSRGMQIVRPNGGDGSASRASAPRSRCDRPPRPSSAPRSAAITARNRSPDANDAAPSTPNTAITTVATSASPIRSIIGRGGRRTASGSAAPAGTPGSGGASPGLPGVVMAARRSRRGAGLRRAGRRATHRNRRARRSRRSRSWEPPRARSR